MKNIHIMYMKHINKTRKLQKHKGGKTFSDGMVSLSYNGEPVLCDICKQNNYEETIGTIDKSKVRTAIRDFFLGSESGNIDNTSVIQYFCNTCGLCKIIRNKDPLVVKATKEVK